MKDYIEYSVTTLFPYVLYNNFIEKSNISGIDNTQKELKDIKQFIKDESSLYPEYSNSKTLSDEEYKKYQSHVENYVDAIGNILKDSGYNLSNISLFKDYKQTNEVYNIPYAYINFFKEVCKHSFLFAYSLLKHTPASKKNIENLFASSDTFSTDISSYITKLEGFMLNDMTLVTIADFNKFVIDLFTKVSDSSSTDISDIKLDKINGTIKNNNKYKYLLFVSLLPFIHLMYYYRRVPGKSVQSIDFSERTLENRRTSIQMIYNNCLFTLYTIYELINKHIPYDLNKQLIGDNLNFMISEIELHSVNNIIQGNVTHNALKNQVIKSQQTISKIKVATDDINLMRSKIVNYINQRDTYNRHAKTYSILYWIALSLLLVYLVVQSVFFFIKSQSISSYMNMVNIGVMIVVLVLFIVSLF